MSQSATTTEKAKHSNSPRGQKLPCPENAPKSQDVKVHERNKPHTINEDRPVKAYL